ncbi:hypothetical protein MPSEU_000970500 [Mayamaea pseudoterrestris]|nr:hypothetical protein MPSEU_000970500 [Mayamaea pseudoterrestris]
MTTSVNLRHLLVLCLLIIPKCFAFTLVHHGRSTPSRARFLSATTTAQPFKNDVCTIQILMSDTGGGHRASANALKDAFDVLFPGRIVCDICDIYTEYGPFWPYNDYPGMYKVMAKNTWSWDLFFKFGSTSFGEWVNKVCLELFCFGPFRECMARDACNTGKRADLVISVHPLCQDLPLRILASLDSNGATRSLSARKTPFCTVVTDLGGAHPTWFHAGVDKCFVPSDALYAQAKGRGLESHQIVQHGLPIRKGFWDGGVGKNAAAAAKTKDITAIKTKLGLDKHMPTVLIVGGGDGMGNIVAMAKALGEKLGQSDTKTQMVVVCGSNKEAEAELDEVTWGVSVKTYIRGFVNNMDEWMSASDVLVTKAGPGTIAEASICGLPCMLFAFLPGQEEGNIPYVENAGFGKYSGDLPVIAETVNRWLSNPGILAEMKQNAIKAARPQATLDIAKDIGEMVFKTKENRQDKVLVPVSRKRGSAAR